MEVVMLAKNRNNSLWAAALITATFSPLQAGCASDCAPLKADYDKAVEQESAFVAQAPDSLPIHFGVTVRDELLNEVVDRALRTGLEKALSLTEAISLATGQKIGLTTKGKVADLGLYPDAACDECLRVDGRLGGSLGVKLPLLGSQSVPLSGTFSIIAPVRFQRGKDGRAAVVLDLKEAAKIAKSQVNPEVTQLPPTWWKVIEAPLSKMLAGALVKDLPPVTLFSFRGFDLGVDGLEVVPAKIVADHKRGVVFAGFSTNLDAPGAALAPRTDLGKNDDVAIGIDHQVLGGLAAALLRGGKISRTWTKAGAEDPKGPIAVTAPTIKLPAADAGQPQPYQMNFRAWNMPNQGQCWWADTEAVGTVSTDDRGQIKVAITEMKLTESSLPGVFKTVANWSTSKLIDKSSAALSRTLTPETIEFGDAAVNLQKSRLTVDGGGAWLSGSVAVRDAANAEPAEEDDDDDSEE